MVLVSGFCFTVKFHIGFLWYVIFTETVDYDVYMYISTFVMTISFDPKDRDECGLTGERAQQLGLTFAKKNFPGQSTFIPVFRVEADDIMMGFYLIEVFVLVVVAVQLLTFRCKRE